MKEAGARWRAVSDGQYSGIYGHIADERIMRGKHMETIFRSGRLPTRGAIIAIFVGSLLFLGALVSFAAGSDTPNADGVPSYSGLPREPVSDPKGDEEATATTESSDLSRFSNTVWTSYSDDEFGYSFRYPAEMVFSEWQPADYILDSVSFYYPETTGNSYMPPEISVTIYNNPKHLSTREWYDAYSEFTHAFGMLVGTSQYTEAPILHIANALDGITFVQYYGGIKITQFAVADGPVVLAVSVAAFDHELIHDIFWVLLESVEWKYLGDPIDNQVFFDTILKMQITSSDLPTSPVEEMGDGLNAIDSGYKLPWTAGARYQVIQGWGGSYSHTCPGQMCYAYDFGIGEGITIKASNTGTVQYARGVVTVCGGSAFRNIVNYVTINHSDGTATTYLHLKSTNVSAGTVISAYGTTIGQAGKTGWTGTGGTGYLLCG